MTGSRRRGKSRSKSPWQVFVCVAAVLAATAWSLTYHFKWGSQTLSVALVFYITATTVLIVSLISATQGRVFHHLESHQGRVLAVVPAYNEPQEAVYDTVWSLINSTRPPESIHVVDDGSTVPVVPFDHPLVTWYRQENAGKREAQAHVLRLVPPESYGVILTVDSDSVLHDLALWQILKPLSNPKIQAATGLTLVKNRTDNLLTRVTDVEMVTWSLATRALRSRLGAVAPTSGSLAVYRKELVLDNLDDYVTSGTAGDDRRLTHYALERGEVVAVNEALVYSAMPTDVGELWRQRVRWFKSYWKYLGWELENFEGWPLFFRLYGLVLTGVAPVLYAWVALEAPYDPWLFLKGFGYWVIMTYAQTGMYVALRPEMSPGQKLTAWLLLTPLVSLMNLLVIKPAMYWAATKAKTTNWGTRQPATAAAVELEDDTPTLVTPAQEGAARLYDPWSDSTVELTLPVGLRDSQEA